MDRPIYSGILDASVVCKNNTYFGPGVTRQTWELIGRAKSLLFETHRGDSRPIHLITVRLDQKDRTFGDQLPGK